MILILLCLALYGAGLADIPPLDRDEARFAQASKQMLETGNFVDIRFQDVPRYKKPVGAYWAQAAAVELLGGDRTAIWAYRVPSLIGAITAVLLTFMLARMFVSRRLALLAAALLATSVLLAAEAHMAKTDAMLLATVTAVQIGIARAWLGRGGGATWLCFWIGIGAGVLLKGPITPMITVLTLAALACTSRSLVWMAALAPVRGLALALLIVLPWFVAIHEQSEGAFLTTAFQGDLLPKLLGGMESHGAPPGYYLVLLAVTFWPGSLLLWPALVNAWKYRREPPVTFLLCWILPVWLCLELVPTKLPHYVLPVFPGLAVLSVLWIGRGAQGVIGHRTYCWFWMAVGPVLAGVVLYAAVAGTAGPGPAAASIPAQLGAVIDRAPLAVLAAPVAVLTGLAGGIMVMRRRVADATLCGLAGGGLFLILLFQFTVPSLPHLFPVPRVMAEIKALDPARNRPVVAAGFHEPSLVFLAGTGTDLTAPEGAARAMAVMPDAIAVIERRHAASFAEAAARLEVPVLVRATVHGLNYSKGREVALDIVTRADRP